MIAVSVFKGRAPALNEKKLPPEFAARAENVDIKHGALRPLRSLLSISGEVKSNTKSIYLYEDQFWFSWTNVVSLVKSPIAQDSYRRVYFTVDDDDETPPQVTSNLIATSSGLPPSASYDLGISQPDPPTVTAVNPPADYDEDDFSDDETRFYVITLVSEYGEEGPPSLASNKILVPAPSSSTSLTLPVHSPNTENIVAKRIYRTAGADGGFFFVAEIPLAVTFFEDSRLDSELGDEITTAGYFSPPSNLRGLTMMANGIVAGFAGNQLFFSEPYLPYAFPSGYSVSTDFDIVAISAISTSLVVVTKGRPYIYSGVTPDAMSEERIAINQSCSSSRSLVDTGSSVIYASPDGLTSISTQGARLLTEDILSKEEWAKYSPDTIHAYFHEGQYVGFYENDSGGGGFIFDIRTGSIVDLSFYASAGYSDISTDTLYLCVNDELFAFASGEDFLNFVWRSKVFEGGRDSYRFIRVICNDFCRVIVRADGKVITSQRVVNSKPVRIPIRKAREWQIEVLGKSEATQVALAKSIAEFRQV